MPRKKPSPEKIVAKLRQVNVLLSQGRSVRPNRPNHVWSYDLVEDRTHNGRKFRMWISAEFRRRSA